MEDRLGTPGAAGMGSNTDTAQWQVDSVNLSLPPLIVVKLRCLSQVEPKGTTNTSEEQTRVI